MQDRYEPKLKAIETDIIAKLKSHQIPLDQWGVNQAKTIRHLVRELLVGESILVSLGNQILRQVETVSVEVLHAKENRIFRLTEDRQEFKDGRVRQRGLKGVNEKKKPGESYLSATERALNEELGLLFKGDIMFTGKEEKRTDSPSYPGLETNYIIYKTKIFLPDYLFKEEGYVEIQEDKSTFFIWKEIGIK